VIVRRTGQTLQLITQPDHAHLAGAIMQHAAALTTHPRRASILLAIAQHDNGWTEPDAAPSIDSAGVPVDFIAAPVAVRQAIWPRGVARLAHDPWAAALVAQHAVAIFDLYRGDRAWTRFFIEMESMRRTMLDASGCSMHDLVADYRFLGLGDLISLTFCNGWSDRQKFDEWSIQLSGSQVFIEPDAFGGINIPIAIDAKEIPQLFFRTDADLRDALAAAPVTRIEGVIRSQDAAA
jgi:hypothetical protein